MLLSEIRNIIHSAAGTSTATYADADGAVDRAFIYAANELIRKGKLNVTSGTKTLTANSSAADLSTVTGFRAERLISAEIGYSDEGQWTTATGYSVRDLVQGDGDPDSYLYVCVKAHTSSSSNEPPNTEYWRRVFSKLGTPIRHTFGYEDIRKRLVCEGRAGVPTEIGFETATDAHLWPQPDDAYILVVHFWQPLTAFTIGGPGTQTITDIPDEYIQRVCREGAATVLIAPHPNALDQNPSWQRYLNVTIPEMLGSKSIPTVARKDFNAYRRSY